MKKVSVKNYTSSVSVGRSAELIEERLVSIGAKQISKTYGDDNALEGITFSLVVNDQPMIFRLPSKWRTVYDFMYADKKRQRASGKEKREEQAQRTAWKLLYDLVLVQTSHILLGQAEVLDLFMAFIYDVQKNQTVFEKFKEHKFRPLLTMNTKE